MALTTVKSDQIQTSVALAGSPTTTTQSASDNSTKVATTAYVETAVANLVASAPSALNTLDELAAALNDDASFSTTVTNSIAAKLPLAGGTLTGDLTSSALIHLSSADPIVKFTDTAGGDTFGIFASASDFLGFYNFSDSRTDLVIDGSGNVGIGNHSPTYLLDMESTATGLTHNLKLNKGSNAGDYAEIAFQLWNGAGTGLNTFGGSGTSRPSVVLRAINEATNSAAGAFVVGTFTGGGDNSTLTEKFRITSAGNVGIGTALPGALLQVNTTSGIGQYIYNTTSAQAYLAFGNSTTGVYSQDFSTTIAGMLVGVDSDETAVVWNGTATALRFGTSAAERMRIDSTGNVGIGTVADPAFTATSFKGLEIQVSGDLFPNVRLERVSGSSKTNQAYEMVIGTAGNWHVRNATQGTAPFSIATTDAITMSRLVGISATPEAHYTGYAALDFGLTGTMYSATSGTNITSLINNAYLNSNASAWVYKQADEASYLAMMDGKFRFFTAAAGSAGGSITWGDEKMQLSAGGYLGIGTGSTTPRYNLQVKGNSTTAVGIALDNVSGSSTLDIAALGSTYNSHQAGPGEVWFYSPDNINIGGATGSTNDIKFIANNKVNMRISAAGLVTKPYNLFVDAYLSSAQAISGWTKVLHNTKTGTNNGGFDTGSGGYTGRFTAPVAGKYLVSVTVKISTASIPYIYTGIWKNGSAYRYIHGANSITTGTDWTYGGSLIIYLAQNEYIEHYAYSNGSASLGAGVSRTSFSIYLLG